MTPNAEHLTVELLLLCRDWDSNTKPSVTEKNPLTHCSTAVALCIEVFILNNMNRKGPKLSVKESL